MMSDAVAKGITHNVIWTNQKTKSFVFRWLHTHAEFDILKCFPAFVRASDVISGILSIGLLSCIKNDPILYFFKAALLSQNMIKKCWR